LNPGSFYVDGRGFGLPKQVDGRGFGLPKQVQPKGDGGKNSFFCEDPLMKPPRNGNKFTMLKRNSLTPPTRPCINFMYL